MSKFVLSIVFLLGSILAHAQISAPARVELAHKCFFNGEYSSAGQSCVTQSRLLKQLNKAGAPIQVHAACAEIVDLEVWQELGCPGGHGSPTEGGYYLETYITTQDMGAVKGQAIELTALERYRIFNCEESAQNFMDYSTDKVTVSAKCQKASALSNKIVTTIELK